MISETLATIDVWYNEPSNGPERPKLLSKLALIELCGWLESEQDRIMHSINKCCLKDEPWTQKELVDPTYGFDYNRHFRPNIVMLIGEHLTRILEKRMEDKFPGDLERFKSAVGHLWKERCAFAHDDIVANVAKQQKFVAPSWTINQHRIINKMLLRFEAEANELARNL